MADETVSGNGGAAQRVISERTRARMAKADLRKPDHAQWRLSVGRAIHRAMTLAGWSLKELAAAIDRDERQIARWMIGTERPQLDTLFAVAALRQPLVIALAELAGDGVEVTTHIRVRRIA